MSTSSEEAARESRPGAATHLENQMSYSTVATPTAGVHATTTVELPDVLATLQLMIDAGRAAELLAGPLAERIELNRQRSERHRCTKTTPYVANGNDHDRDVALKLTSHGIVAECRRCGKQVAS